MGIYFNAGGKLREPKEIYAGAGGKLRKIKAVYAGKGGKPALVWQAAPEKLAVWAAVGQGGAWTAPASPDPGAWTKGTGIPASAVLHAVTYGNGRFVAVGEKGASYTSRDGKAWEAMSGLPADRDFYGAAYGMGHFAAVGAGQAAYYSTDGRAWHAMAGTGGAGNYTCAACHKGEYIVFFSDAGRAFFSEDGEAYSQMPLDTNPCPGFAPALYGTDGSGAVGQYCSYMDCLGYAGIARHQDKTSAVILRAYAGGMAVGLKGACRMIGTSRNLAVEGLDPAEDYYAASWIRTGSSFSSTSIITTGSRGGVYKIYNTSEPECVKLGTGPSGIRGLCASAEDGRGWAAGYQ